MKTNKTLILKTFLGMVVATFFLFSYSCSPETDLDVLEDLERVNASAKKSEEEAGKKRPWKIRSSGTFQPIGPSPSCTESDLPNTILLEGSGTASHIGLYEVAITWCTNVDFDLASEKNAITGTLTVANGDLIFFRSLRFNGESVDYEVTGGDGRFYEAKGEFTLFTVEFDPVDGTYANEGGGFIIY